MGLFKEYEKVANIENPLDKPASGEVVFDKPIEMNIHIIRRDEIEVELMDGSESVADYETNPDGDQTHIIYKDARITQNGNIFVVIGIPVYLPSVNVTKIRLKQKMINE